VPNPYFKFKQFTVFHDQCAMKVNTDGCLLGSWAAAKSPQSILDIGTGSGVIALMLAQKYPQAQVDGVEIENTCAKQCIANFTESPFADRLRCYCNAIQDFESDVKYDLIVSNPPYFQNNTPSPNKKRHQARHQMGLSLEELFRKTTSLLTTNGTFCLILPKDLRNAATEQASKTGLHQYEEITLRPLPNKPPHRVLLSFSTRPCVYMSDELSIEIDRGHYSPDVTKWLKPYYLNL
jgi:tRNA1Val (adenine37-N6)-methyltransferase